jgi:hypothetical protein
MLRGVEHFVVGCSAADLGGFVLVGEVFGQVAFEWHDVDLGWVLVLGGEGDLAIVGRDRGFDVFGLVVGGNVGVLVLHTEKILQLHQLLTHETNHQTQQQHLEIHPNQHHQNTT